MNILGISSYYHDSSASLLVDGKIVSAVEQERFSRIKHDNAFPYDAINYCLRNSNLKINDINYIAYYEKPLLKLERILENFIRTYPRSFVVAYLIIRISIKIAISEKYRLNKKGLKQ